VSILRKTNKNPKNSHQSKPISKAINAAADSQVEKIEKIEKSGSVADL
jgi:hypothetical protein